MNSGWRQHNIVGVCVYDLSRGCFLILHRDSSFRCLFTVKRGIYPIIRQTGRQDFFNTAATFVSVYVQE